MRSEVIIVVVIGLSAFCSAQDFVCDGDFEITNIEKCENPLQYKIQIDMKKRKVNRTHDGISFKADLTQELTDDIGVLIEVYSKRQGGYKFQQYYTEESVCGFFNRFAKDNFERILTEAGIDPPRCPIRKGNCYAQGMLEINDFIVEYGEVQDQGMSGEYKMNFYMVQGPIKLACMVIYCSWTCRDGGDDDDFTPV